MQTNLSINDRLATAVNKAKQTGQGFVEVDAEVLDFFLPNKTDRDVGYFHYQDIRVYELGKREEIEKRESMSSEEINFHQRSGAV